jgi:hypothetical protein
MSVFGVDISDMDISHRVHEHVNARYYSAMLGAIMNSARSHGILFDHCKHAAWLPAKVLQDFAVHASRARCLSLHSSKTEDEIDAFIDDDLETGTIQTLVKDMLDGLSHQGIRPYYPASNVFSERTDDEDAMIALQAICCELDEIADKDRPDAA